MLPRLTAFLWNILIVNALLELFITTESQIKSYISKATVYYDIVDAPYI